MKKVQARLVAFSIILIALMLFACGSGSDSVYPIPQTIYLQAVTSDSVYVMAESPGTAPLTVVYGPTTSYGRSATTVSTRPTTGGTFIHRIFLTGLTPDTILLPDGGQERQF